MQKRNPAVLMGVGRVTKTGRKDGAHEIISLAEWDEIEKVTISKKQNK